MAGESWALWVQVLCTWSVSIPRQLEMSGRNSVWGSLKEAAVWGPTEAAVLPSSHHRTLLSYGSNVTVT